MENERPRKRHSLLPQRSTSIVSNSQPQASEDTGKLGPPPRPKQRDISPSKLPVGGLRRTQSIGPKTEATHQTAHKKQQSFQGLAANDMPTITPVRGTGSTAQQPSNRKPTSMGYPTASHSKTFSHSSRPTTSYRAAPSFSQAPSGSTSRPASSGKDLKTTSTPATRAPSKTLANVKVQRPASITHQRPASPKKAAQVPAISKFALLTTPPAPAAKPQQDAKLELLHLHSLHKESHSTKTQWTQSAKSHYQKHFNRLIQLEEAHKAAEMDFVEQQNAAALIEWCKEVSSTSGESKTAAFSNILNEMWLLVGPGGRYTAAVNAFEDWHKMVEAELDHRLHDAHIDIMEGLGDGWKAEVDALMSALCRCSDDLESLGPAIEPSDLARCLNVLMTMLANMLEELVLVRDIENTLVEREGSWVKDRIQGLSAKVSGEH